eukprot:gene4318-5404_t
MGSGCSVFSDINNDWEDFNLFPSHEINSERVGDTFLFKYSQFQSIPSCTSADDRHHEQQQIMYSIVSDLGGESVYGNDNILLKPNGFEVFLSIVGDDDIDVDDGKINNIFHSGNPFKWSMGLVQEIENHWESEYKDIYGRNWNYNCNSYTWAKFYAEKLSLTKTEYIKIGERCHGVSSKQECELLSFCPLDNSNETRACTKYSLEGQGCGDAYRQCLPDTLECDIESKTCKTPAGQLRVGEKCSESRQCYSELCQDGTCKLPDDHKCKDDLDCSAGHFCNQFQCIKEKQSGESCQHYWECANNLVCEGNTCTKMFSLGKDSSCSAEYGRSSSFPKSGCDIAQSLWCDEQSKTCKTYKELSTDSGKNCSLSGSEMCSNNVPESCLCNKDGKTATCQPQMVLGERCKEFILEYYNCQDDKCRQEHICGENPCESTWIVEYGNRIKDPYTCVDPITGNIIKYEGINSASKLISTSLLLPVIAIALIMF